MCELYIQVILSVVNFMFHSMLYFFNFGLQRDVWESELKNFQDTFIPVQLEKQKEFFLSICRLFSIIRLLRAADEQMYQAAEDYEELIEC